MVSVNDGLGRPLYVLDTSTMERFHPYIGKPVPNDYEHEYETQDKRFKKIDNFMSVAPFILFFIALIMIAACALFR
jgi:hypothetical protein